MRTKRHQFGAFFLSLVILATSACSAPPRAPDLGGLYNELARSEDPYRNPVILIPGILGSKLVDRPSDVIVWGAFGLGNANPNTAEGARLDERGPDSQTSRLSSPIGWKQVMFLFSDHRNITNDPTFTDNLLYILLERPRE